MLPVAQVAGQKHLAHVLTVCRVTKEAMKAGEMRLRLRRNSAMAIYAQEAFVNALEGTQKSTHICPHAFTGVDVDFRIPSPSSSRAHSYSP